MHRAMGLEPTEYDYQVFRITSEISKQVFPLTLDIDNPAFRAGLDRLCEISEAGERAKAEGGLLGRIKHAAALARAFGVFTRLYLLPVKSHELPAQVRVAPAW
jgi:magnesium-protoporphyrin IX monomethyl ester (oxidative) cyclase